MGYAYQKYKSNASACVVEFITRMPQKVISPGGSFIRDLQPEKMEIRLEARRMKMQSRLFS